MADRSARPEDNRLFRDASTLPASLWEDLAARPPLEAARQSGASYEDEGGFSIRFLDGGYRVDPGRRLIVSPAGSPEADFQKGMILLSYLAKAQDLGLSGRMVSPRELNGGELFFKGPHAPCTAPLTERFGGDPENFMARALARGARPQGDGGYAWIWRVLPHIDLGCVLYPGDEEFPAEVTYTFDSYSQYHLALDGLWAITNVVAGELAGGG